MDQKLEMFGRLQVRPSMLHIGSIVVYAGEQPPEGWAWCDGREIDRTEYPALFKMLGTRFGEGDGSSTFNIPDIPKLIPGAAYAIRLGLTAEEEKALAETIP